MLCYGVDLKSRVVLWTRAVSFAACEEDWDITPGMGSVGGEFQTASSLQHCLDLCLSHPDCVAVDVSAQAPFFCFLHDNQSLTANDTYTNPSMSQYMLLTRCPQGSSVKTINFVKYNFEKNVLL